MKSARLRLSLLAAFLLVFSFFLRRRPRVEQRITILASPDAVFRWRWMIRRDFARSLANLKALVENVESTAEITA